VVAVLAALWRPARQGALLLAGAIIPLAAQAVSALIQVSRPAYSFFGLTQAQAAQEGVTISSGVTPVFWVYCVFVVSLLVSCAWLLTAPGQPPVAASPWAPAPFDEGGRVPYPPTAEIVGDAADSDSADPAPADEESFEKESFETEPAESRAADSEAPAAGLG